MPEINAKKRSALPSSSFALPSERKYPIHDASHVRNAAARLEQEKSAGKISASSYRQAKTRIARAAKKFGIASEYNGAAPKPGARGGISVRAHVAPGGELHVRHMNDGEAITCRVAAFEVELRAGAAGERFWTQIARLGHFEGHRAGVFDITPRTFSEIVQNFKNVDQSLRPFDFEHASEAEAADVADDGAPAQGWIHEMKIEGDKLFGLVEWLEPASSYIKAQKYKFVSPAIRFNAVHPETGKPIGARLTSAALTNGPFLRGMMQVAASDRTPRDVEHNGAGDIEVLHEREASTLIAMKAGYAHHPNEYMPKVRAALRCHDLDGAAECADRLDQLRDKFEFAGRNAAAVVDGCALSDFMMPLRDLVGAQPGVTWDAIFDLVENLIAEAMEMNDGGALVADEDDEGGGDDAGAMVANAPSADDADGRGTAEADEDEEMKAKAAAAAASASETTAVSTTDTNGETVMGMNAEEKAKFDQLEATAREQAAELDRLKSSGASLTLDAKDAQTKAEKAEAELATLREAQKQRDAADQTARVEEAFGTYKDAKKLTEDDKGSMLIELKADPQRFEKRYPKVARAEQHLLADLTGKTAQTAPTTVDGGGARNFPLREVAKRIARDKNIPLAEAQRLAMQVHHKLGGSLPDLEPPKKGIASRHAG